MWCRQLALCLLPLLTQGAEQLWSNSSLKLEGRVKAGNDVTFSISVAESLPLRIQARAGVEDPKVPVLFTLRRGDNQHSWRIPTNANANNSRPRESFTKVLCESSLMQDTMQLTVSTRSREEKSFSVTFDMIPPIAFDLVPDSEKTVTISPTEMGLYKFQFSEPDEDTFLLVVTSQEPGQEVCSILSIQPRRLCPEIHDQESNMRSGEGTQYQTFLGRAALMLERSRYPDGVHVVLLAQETDTGCYRRTQPNHTHSSQRTMKVSVEVRRLEANKIEAAVAILAFYLLLGFMAGGLSFFMFRTMLFEFDGKFELQEVRTVERQRKKQRRSQHEGTLSTVLAMVRWRRQSQAGPVRPAAPEATDGPDRAEATEMSTRRAHTAIRSPLPAQARAVPERDTGSTSEGEGAGEQSPCCGAPPKPKSPKLPRRFLWQDTWKEPDELDGERRGQTIRQEHVRSRHASEATQEELPYIKKVVTLDKKKIKTKRTNSDVTLADLAVRSNPEYFKDFLWRRSEQFVWIVFVVGIYYTLPVFQLVLYYQNVSLTKGDMDTCYYNFLCLYPWGPLADFGHVFSNIGYIICGGFFILIVKNRSRKYAHFCSTIDEAIEKEKHPKYTGIPESYGILYGMGGALIMEGILSGCYHICPTAENFQFDTTFMYVISVLVFLKVYQLRHPDITSEAQFVFTWIGFALVFEMIGYFTQHILFWIVFIVIYVAFILTFVVHVYYHATGASHAYHATGLGKAMDRLKAVRENRGGSSQPEAEAEASKEDGVWLHCDGKKLGRLIPTILIVLVNIAVAMFIAWNRKAGVSRYLLVIMMVNMNLYIIYYVGHKLYYRLRPKAWLKSEGFRPITVLYIVLSIGFMLGAGYFFKKELKSSSGTAAESRNLNDVCYMMIFDNHDMWHFFSAAGLFFLFMFILTIEDYNKERPRHQIIVF